MKSVLQGKTLIGTIREHVIAWRKAEGWSRETVSQNIVEAHQVVGAGSGIVFEPETRDPIEIREVNAQKIFRWLDDDSKGTNLLPANFIPSILAAMPVDRRLACAAEIMVSIGLGACLLDQGEEGVLDINDIFEAQLASGNALQAATKAFQHPTAENLEDADLYMGKSEIRQSWLRKKIAGARNMYSGTKALLKKVCHPTSVPK